MLTKRSGGSLQDSNQEGTGSSGPEQKNRLFVRGFKEGRLEAMTSLDVRGRRVTSRRLRPDGRGPVARLAASAAPPPIPFLSLCISSGVM